MENVARTLFAKYNIGDFVIGAAETEEELTLNPKIGVVGEVAKCLVIIPIWSNLVTAVVSVLNEDGFEIWESDPLDRDESYDITLARNECILYGKVTEKVKVVLSGVPGGIGGTVNVKFYMRK